MTVPQHKLYASHAQRQAAYHRRREEARRQQLQEKGLPPLPALPSIPGTARWRLAIANAAALLAPVEGEMEAYRDDRTDAWLDSERAQNFEERLDAVRDTRAVVDDLLD
jgi:hypothetical protein